MSKKLIVRCRLVLLLLTLQFQPLHDAAAHGEKALEPFIRTRTIQWFDVQWSKPDIQVNEALIVTGKFHVTEDWPVGVPKPDAAFLNISAPGPVLIRTERYLNGQPWINSAALRPGADYDFKVVLKARVPGRYHIHPFFNLKDAGPVMGPGQWVSIGGNADDFVNQIKTIQGEVVDMESYGLLNAGLWHGWWMAVGLAWLLWWLRRPLFMPRYRQVKAGQLDGLVSQQDRTIAKIILVAVPVMVLTASEIAQSSYANAIPLQASLDRIEPLAQAVNTSVHVKVLRAEYSVADRSMKFTAQVHNQSTQPIQLSEFSTASLRFLNEQLAQFQPPADGLTIKDSLHVVDNTPIAAGETRAISFAATDANWKNEKLDGLLNDADSRIGGLLVFYTADGKRSIAAISAPVLPVFN